ncbi:malonate decarboxylase subunit epsilon [Methylopila henanensis]|uniref:Malonyl CoA-acyl carrier protein transacylase n=1 Tax=Methylopila henanensis TaxID=873516 RepID=A0ABW4K8T9_9HYPH
MLRTALLFPGQGSQRPGMLSGLPDHPEIRAALEEAADALGRDWRDFDAAETLARTHGAQLALTIAGVAAARALLAEGARVDVVAGHSVGAFPAAVTAGALTFRDALRLVALRGGLMAESHPQGYGMTAIVGLRESVVAALVEEARRDGDLYVANRNAELQIVVSGAEAALAHVEWLAVERGARKAERLNVRTPSHCPLVAPVASCLRDALSGVELQPPRRAIVSARTARRLSTPQAIAEDLARNVAEPVRWRDAVRLLLELGVTFAIEVPPGSTLKDLAADVMGEAYLATVEGGSLTSLAQATQRLAGEP